MRRRKQDPIWQLLRDEGRTKRWLANATQYHPVYVRSIASGRERASDAFKLRCSAALGRPVSDLFSIPCAVNAHSSSLSTEAESVA